MDNLTFAEALTIEENLPPGPYEIKGFMLVPLTRAELDQLRAELIDAGVQLINLTQSGSVLVLRAVKPEPVEGIAVFPFIAAIALLGGLAIVMYSIVALPNIIDAFVPIILIITAGVVIAKTAPVVLSRK